MLLFATSVHAQPATSVKPPVIATAEGYALKQLVAVLAQTTTLQSDVHQLLMDQDGRELQETDAKLAMQKPGSFRWEVTKPFNELMVTDGKIIWRFEPDLQQVTIAAFNTKVDRSPVMLLNGSEQSIGEGYTVSSTLIDGVHQRFLLEPKKPDSLFTRMSMTFKGAILEELQFEDSLGQQTSLSFENVQRNLMLDATLFQFTPSSGVDVIDNTKP